MTGPQTYKVLALVSCPGSLALLITITCVLTPYSGSAVPQDTASAKLHRGLTDISIPYLTEEIL